MKTVLKRSALVLGAAFAVLTLSGCSSNKENGEIGVLKSTDEVKPPTEKEVSDTLQDALATCVPKEELEKKAKSFDEKYPESNFRYDDISMYCSGICAEQKEQEQKEWYEWMGKRVACSDFYRKMTDDRFVLFKKTDGQVNGPGQYKMLGIVTVFNSKTGKEEEHKTTIKFELMESGWDVKASGVNVEKNIPR